jgi:hypothetical protein
MEGIKIFLDLHETFKISGMQSFNDFFPTIEPWPVMPVVIWRKYNLSSCEVSGLFSSAIAMTWRPSSISKARFVTPRAISMKRGVRILVLTYFVASRRPIWKSDLDLLYTWKVGHTDLDFCWQMYMSNRCLQTKYKCSRSNYSWDMTQGFMTLTYFTPEK